MRLEARDWVSCCDTHLQGCAEEPVLEAQGAKKSEGRACAKVCGRLRPGKGEGAGLHTIARPANIAS